MRVNFSPHFHLLRISNWRGYFLISSFGFFLADGFSLPLQKIILFYIILILFFAFGFSINDCFDTKEDKLNKEKKNPLVLQSITLKKALIFSLSLAFLGLFLSTLLGLKFFIFAFLGILLVFLYSAPPFRLKSRPFLDLLSHGLFAGAFLFFIPFFVSLKEITPLYYWIAFSFFYFSVILELRNHIEDYHSDKKAGLTTTVFKIGLENSEKFLRSLALFYPLILAPIFFFEAKEQLLFFLTISLIFFFFLFYKKEHKIVKNSRIMDIYASLSFILLVFAFL